MEFLSQYFVLGRFRVLLHPIFCELKAKMGELGTAKVKKEKSFKPSARKSGKMKVKDEKPDVSDNDENVVKKEPPTEKRITLTQWQLEHPDYRRIPKSLRPKKAKASKPKKDAPVHPGLSVVEKRQDPFPGKKPLSAEDKEKAKNFDRGGFFNPKEMWQKGAVERKNFVNKERRKKMVSEDAVRMNVLLTEESGYGRKYNFLS